MRRGASALSAARALRTSPAVLGEPLPHQTALDAHSNVQDFETLNLVDGKRSIGEIRDVLTGRYGPTPLDQVVEWLDLLARAGVVRFRPVR